MGDYNNFNIPSQGMPMPNPRAPPIPHPNQGLPFQAPPAKKKSKIWLIITISIILVILLIAIIYLLIPKDIKVSNSDLISGTNIDFDPEKSLIFKDGETEKYINLEDANEEFIGFIISEMPIRELKISEEEKLDLDSDGFYDLKIKFNSFNEGIPSIYIKKINERVCEENWICEPWDDCLISNSQSRTCTDFNSCGTYEERPLISQSCIYIEPICIEDWDCDSWSECFAEEQERDCDDLNSCGTYEDKPREERDCEMESIECGYNVQNDEVNDEDIWDCFIDASSNCDSATMTNEVTLNFFGVLYTTTQKMEIEELSSGKCELSEIVEEVDIGYSEEVIQALIADGVTPDEINEGLAEANTEADLTIGAGQECEFEKEILESMLSDWKEGTYTSSVTCDYVDGEYVCTHTGNYEGTTCITIEPQTQ